MGKSKDDLKWPGHGIHIWRFGRNGSLIYSRWESVEVDLNDLSSEYKILDVVGCGGTLHFHLTKKSARALFSWRAKVSYTGENPERDLAEQNDLGEYGYEIAP